MASNILSLSTSFITKWSASGLNCTTEHTCQPTGTPVPLRPSLPKERKPWETAWCSQPALHLLLLPEDNCLEHEPLCDHNGSGAKRDSTAPCLNISNGYCPSPQILRILVNSRNCFVIPSLWRGLAKVPIPSLLTPFNSGQIFSTLSLLPNHTSQAQVLRQIPPNVCGSSGW